LDISNRYKAKFQYVEHEEFDDKSEDLTAMEQSLDDAGYLPRHHTTTEEGESLSQLFHDWLVDRHREISIVDEAYLGNGA
jgi:hypothetical protein